MLTNSCVKLQTVHSIPMTMNKEGQFHAGLSLGRISIKFFSLTFDLSAAPYRRRVLGSVRLPERHRPLCVGAQTEFK